MNIALFALRPTTILAPVIAELKPTVILTSSYLPLDKRLADVAIQLDELIHFENIKIDVVCVINEPNLNLNSISNFSQADYIDRVYYTTNRLHTSSFYCKPSVFTLLSNLYKVDFNQLQFNDNNTVEFLTEKIFYLINR